jgi:gamma-glutamylcyclotransferase (GGCT)/AIG2-like uncharacterized protein YtfP
MQYLPLFVYGTLRRGFGNYNNYLRGKVADIVPGTIKGEMFDVGAFPAVVCGEYTVVGELMYIDLADYVDTMKNCDILEGYNPDADFNMYERQIIEVNTEDGIKHAWVYIWEMTPPSNYRKVANGDWAAYYRNRQYVG